MLRLDNDELSVEVAPEIGGGIASFRAFGLDIFRPARHDAIARRDPLGLSCFPMTPFVNRIAYGRFEFCGEQITIGPPSLPHPLHGYGWRASWRVDRQTPQSAVLSWLDERGIWPWRYRTEQRLVLDPDALTVELSVENQDGRPMPASLGLHPYFPGIADAQLQADADGVWMTDTDLIPTHWVAISDAPVSFNTARGLQGTALDNCYTAFGGEAQITWPQLGAEVVIGAPTCRFMQVYTRGGDGSFCVEAQTAMPDAVNRPGSPQETGLHVVAPGERLACVTRFQVKRG
jgi:aldose 1-epimerase